MKDEVVQNLKNTSTSSSKLLLAAKSLVADPNAPNAKNALANAARYGLCFFSVASCFHNDFHFSI